MAASDPSARTAAHAASAARTHAGTGAGTDSRAAPCAYSAAAARPGRHGVIGRSGNVADGQRLVLGDINRHLDAWHLRQQVLCRHQRLGILRIRRNHLHTRGFGHSSGRRRLRLVFAAASAASAIPSIPFIGRKNRIIHKHNILVLGNTDSLFHGSPRKSGPKKRCERKEKASRLPSSACAPGRAPDAILQDRKRPRG